MQSTGPHPLEWEAHYASFAKFFIMKADLPHSTAD